MAPALGPGPHLEPIFSPLVMENVPTSHTDSYLAGYSKGSLTASSAGAAVFSPSLPSSQT